MIQRNSRLSHFAKCHKIGPFIDYLKIEIGSKKVMKQLNLLELITGY